MDVTYARLNAARKYLGNNPRRGFFASISSFFLEKQVASITEQISTVTASTDVGALIYDIRRGGTSSHLFQIYSSHNYRPFGNCPIKHVSDWSFNRLLEKYKERLTLRSSFLTSSESEMGCKSPLSFGSGSSSDPFDLPAPSSSVL